MSNELKAILSVVRTEVGLGRATVLGHLEDGTPIYESPKPLSDDDTIRLDELRWKSRKAMRR